MANKCTMIVFDSKGNISERLKVDKTLSPKIAYIMGMKGINEPYDTDLVKYGKFYMAIEIQNISEAIDIIGSKSNGKEEVIESGTILALKMRAKRPPEIEEYEISVKKVKRK